MITVFNGSEKIKRIIISLFLILTLLQPASSSPKSEHETFSYLKKFITCKHIKNGEPYGHTERFGVEDKIYVFVSWQNVKGTHTAEAYWYDHQDKLRSVAPVSFKSPNGFYNSWFWFKISQTTWERYFTPVSSVDSMGNWHVDIYLDGEFIQRLDFMMG